MDDTDRAIVNSLQGGFPVCERPYAKAAERLGIGEEELIGRLTKLLAQGLLSRFGPMYHAERLGGALSLAAMHVPEEDFERVAAIVNAMPEVAHNYQRSHALNMWFVLATEAPAALTEAVARIERETGCRVYNMPKLKEYFLELKFRV